MKAAAQSLTVCAGKLAFLAPIPVASRMEPDKFATAVTKIALREEPRNPANTETRVKERRAWQGSSAEGCLSAAQTLCEATLGSNAMTFNNGKAIGHQLLDGLNRDNFVDVTDNLQVGQSTPMALATFMLCRMNLSARREQKRAMRRD